MTLSFPFGSRHQIDGGETYTEKVLGIQAANLILYHPMNEPSGGTATDASSAGNDGAYTGVTLGQTGIGDGETCPLFDGTNDYNDIYSSPGFKQDFNGAAGTIAMWLKVSAAGVWEDGVGRRALEIKVDANSSTKLMRDTTNNQFIWNYKAGGTAEIVTKGSLSTTGWFHIAITWDKAGSGNMIAYYAGSPEGSAQAIAGTWSGEPATTSTVIGAQTTVPASAWSGYIAHCAIWKVALGATDIASLATV